jgi:Tfp pilus assembly protein PilO
MKVSDKAIVFGVLVAVLAIGFYLMLLAPKRQKASELNDQIDQLHASISQQEQVASFAEDARKEFPRYYGRLVVLGKAVPQQADTGSMLVQLNTIAGDSHVDFRSIELGGDAGSAGSGSSAASTPTASAASNSTAAPAGTSTTPSTGTTGSTTPSTGSTAPATSSTTSTASATAVPATESSAASLPIGAVVGPAGLATLPYTLTFKGGYFDIANFIGGVDNLVEPTASGVRVTPDGRLFTVDGFDISGGLPGSSPRLTANFAVTTFATPATQGLTLGASPSGPAPAIPGAAPAQPASAVVAK